MVFLHGHPDGARLYAGLVNEFGRSHLAVAPNLRGYPPSDVPNSVEDYSMAGSLNDLHCLLDHFEQQECVLIGNDWGGYVAWVFASAYPSRVRQLIIMNAPHPMVHLSNVNRDELQNRASQYERGFNAAPAPFPPWYNYYRADPIKVPAAIDPDFTADASQLSSFFSDVERVPERTDLHVDVPTLVIWGMLDPHLLPTQLDGLSAYAPNASIIRIPDAGHLPMRDQPDKVSAAIWAFTGR